MQAPTPLSEINYFPTSPANIRIKRTENEVQLRVKVYNKVVEFLIKDAGFKKDIVEENNIGTKDALAFFIEANSQLNSKDWQEQIDSIIERLQEFRNEQSGEAYKKSTWTLNDLVHNLYIHSIAAMGLLATNQQDKKSETFFEQVLKNHNANMTFRESQKNRRGRAVSFGGINNHFIPEWYKKHFPANT